MVNGESSWKLKWGVKHYSVVNRFNPKARSPNKCFMKFFRLVRGTSLSNWTGSQQNKNDIPPPSESVRQFFNFFENIHTRAHMKHFFKSLFRYSLHDLDNVWRWQRVSESVAAVTAATQRQSFDANECCRNWSFAGNCRRRCPNFLIICSFTRINARCISFASRLSFKGRAVRVGKQRTVKTISYWRFTRASAGLRRTHHCISFRQASYHSKLHTRLLLFLYHKSALCSEVSSVHK